MRVAVTGAYGYSGQYMARRLLDQGHEVLTLTNSTRRSNPFGEKVKAQPFNFSNPALLEQTLRGVDVLINNYWVRFDLPPLFTHAAAVLHAKTLFEAAKWAGVARIVHITSPIPTGARIFLTSAAKPKWKTTLDRRGYPTASCDRRYCLAKRIS